jgi:hypothetical protein
MNAHFHADDVDYEMHRALPLDHLDHSRDGGSHDVGPSSDSNGKSPFSPLMCFLLLVMAGMLVKFNAAFQLLHLAH